MYARDAPNVCDYVVKILTNTPVSPLEIEIEPANAAVIVDLVARNSLIFAVDVAWKERNSAILPTEGTSMGGLFCWYCC
jgi:hypothetical protein